MDEVEDEPLFRERVAGIDIGKTTIMVTIRVPSGTRRGRRQQETREFRAVRKDLLALADWLRCWGVTRIGMEATGDYWKPVCFLLEREGLDCVLYHASQVKALPGRPRTDKLDSVWLAKITGRGNLPGSFVPPEDIRRLRTRTRCRRHLVQTRTAEKNRCEKLLEDDLLTELQDVSAVQVGRPSQWSIAEMVGRSGLPGCCSVAASPIATETGHAGRNQSPAFSSLPLFDVSRGGPLVLLQCP